MKNGPVYTEFKPDMLENFLGLILTLQRETRPIAGHGDPGAVKDCWNSLIEQAKLVAQKARQAVGVEERLNKCIAHTKWEMENMSEEAITAKLLTTGRMNGYNFVKAWFGFEKGKHYAAKREQMRNDLFWNFHTPDDFENLKWTGYNDSNWWINVVPEIGQMQRKDKRGRVWELDPRTDTVILIKNTDTEPINK